MQDSAGRLGEVMAEQTARLQELRRQLSSGHRWRACSGSELAVELQAMQEELCLALRREKESQELSRSQAARVDAFTRMLHEKDELIRVSEQERGSVQSQLPFNVSRCLQQQHLCVCLQAFQRQLVEPSALPLVEQLTQEVQELRESLVQQRGALDRGPVLDQDRASIHQPEFGGGHQSVGQCL